MSVENQGQIPHRKISTVERVHIPVHPRKYSTLERVYPPPRKMSTIEFTQRRISGSGEYRPLKRMATIYSSPMHHVPARVLGDCSCSPLRNLSIDSIPNSSPARKASTAVEDPIRRISGTGSAPGAIRINRKISVATRDFGKVDLRLEVGPTRKMRSLSCYLPPNVVGLYGEQMQLHRTEIPKQTSTFPQQLRSMKNIVILAFSFMCVYAGFAALRNHQSVLHFEDDPSLGLLSLSILYGVMVVSTLFSAILANKLTPKWTIVMAFVVFTLYFVANLYPNRYTMIPASAAVGLVGGPLWNAQTSYLQATSRKYAFVTEELQEKVHNRFSRLFGTIYQASMVIGNTVAVLVFSGSQVNYNKAMLPMSIFRNETEPPPYLDTKLLCGVAECYHDDVTSLHDLSVYSMKHFSISSNLMLISIFIGCSVVGIVMCTIFLDKLEPTYRHHHLHRTSLRIFANMLRLLRDQKLQLLILLVFFVGLEQGFVYADFTKSFVYCALDIETVGYTMLCYGATAMVSVVTISHVTKHINRLAIIASGVMFHAGLLMVLWLWKPDVEDKPIVYVVASGWGLCDVIWQSQTYNLFGILLSDTYDQAYTAYYMFQAAGLAAAFAISPLLCIDQKIYVVGGTLGAALLFYSVIELKIQKFRKEIKKGLLADGLYII